MKHINILEIENGFVVELFSEHGPANLDKTVYCKTWNEVSKLVDQWSEAENNSTEEKAQA